MTLKYKPTEMRSIWYGKRQWSPRTTIVSTVIDAIVTGFLLGLTLLQYLRGHSALSYLTPFALTFLSAVATLRGTLIALRNCPQPTKTAEAQAPLRNASV